MTTDAEHSLVAQVGVVGAGIAGAWTAYRLAQRGVRTILISADDLMPSISRKLSIGLVKPVLADGEVELPAAVTRYFAEEFAELSGIVNYTEVAGLMRPGGPAERMRTGLGGTVIAAVLTAFHAAGGRQVRGRVTDLVMDGDICLGVRYQPTGARDVVGTVRCADVVLASGGFSGLFASGVGGNNGYLLGTYARCGGMLTELEQFTRFPLGNLDRKKPHYSFEYDEPVELLRDGKPADELMHALGPGGGHTRDLEVFRGYWLENLDVPHTAVFSGGSFRLGPIKGFCTGGALDSSAGNAPCNVHVTGECADGLVFGWAPGLPFASFLVRGRELADELACRPWTEPGEFSPGDIQPGADSSLRKTVEQRLEAFQDSRFTVDAAERFALWCTQERQRRLQGASDMEDVDLLILAEAYTRSVLARVESRGFFFRPDYPNVDPHLDDCRTTAEYSVARDRVFVTIAPPTGN